MSLTRIASYLPRVTPFFRLQARNMSARVFKPEELLHETVRPKTTTAAVVSYVIGVVTMGGVGYVLSERNQNKFYQKLADEKSLDRYFELLSQYPKLKREGDVNDASKGAYQIVYDLTTIKEIREECYTRHYIKAIARGLSHAQVVDEASLYSRIGVVAEDQFLVWVRDAVISPSGYRHTYDRIIWKSSLDNVAGAAAIPIIKEDGVSKIVLQKVFRHATGEWTMEVARGGSKKGETPLETAKREVQEETGYETAHLVELGRINPDSGLTSSDIPIFIGTVTKDVGSKHDKTEAIKARHAFTKHEVLQGLQKGYMEVEEDGKKVKVHIGDPFLAYGLLMAQNNGHI